MTSDPDEALRWEGDESPTTPTLPEGWNAVGKGSETVEVCSEQAATAGEVAEGISVPDATQHPDVPSEGLSTAALVSFGVLSGVFLLYAVGWAIGGLRLQPLARFLVADAMYLPWMWLAVLAPALWVIAALVLTRGRATWIRILAMLAGVVLLVPWPFVMVGVIGS